MMDIKNVFKILENLERCKEALCIRENYTKEQMMFAESLSKIWQHDYPEEYQDYLYNKAKAERYNLDWDYDVYDPIGLAQAIDQHEWSERKHQYNNDWDYYSRLGVR
jgi:hypothetical protein